MLGRFREDDEDEGYSAMRWVTPTDLSNMGGEAAGALDDFSELMTAARESLMDAADG